MLKRKSFRRPKVNCFCRCTPREGIVALHPDYVAQMVDNTKEIMSSTRSTGIIAAAALRTGQMLEQTGHLPICLDLYGRALQVIYYIDSDRLENYYLYGALPPNPHYRRWSERSGEAHACMVARRLDELCLRMGFRGYAHQRRKTHVDYRRLFNGVYAACM